MVLLSPGPVYLTSEINNAQTREMIHHRHAEFREIHERVIENSRKLFGSDEAYYVSGSGTAAIEAMLCSLIGPDDVVFVPHNGKFGERVRDISKIYAKKVVEKKFEYGKGVDLERVKAEIDDAKPNVVAMVFNDTSTAILNHVKEIAAYAHQKGAMVAVDGVSAIGGTPFSQKQWNVDICVTGSQKCIGAPPGLGLVGVNSEVVAKIEKTPVRNYYLHLKEYRKWQAEKKQTPYTPAINTVFAVDVALQTAMKEGLEARWERHAKWAERTRSEVGKLGFGLFAENGFQSPTLTAFKSDKAEEIQKALKAQKVIIEGGQGEMKGKILRVAHMGNFMPEHLEMFYSALGQVVGK